MKIISDSKISAKAKDGFLTLDSALNVPSDIEITANIEDNTETTTISKLKVKKNIFKKDVIGGLKHSIVELVNVYHDVFGKRIILFLDDFYYIKRDKQPYVLNYIHQVNKTCTNSSFSFKLSALPNRFKMNYDNELIYQ